MGKKLRITILGLCLLIVSVFSYSFVADDFEISKNIDVFVTLYKELNKNYVDELDPGQMIEEAIDGMLESLDPYTVYISESEVEDYKFMTTGQYGGIGSLIHKQGDYVIISEPYEGFPADKAGLKAGDKILEVNGKSAKGKNVSDVSSVLKGSPGTIATLKIQRLGEEKPFSVDITREVIKIDNIPYYGKIDDNIGYIKLTGFTQNAGREVKEAFLEMKSEGELKGLILDLRGNGGGLLHEAVNIVNIFVKKGVMVVSTKGKLKQKNQTHKTLNAPTDTEIPLVVLVDPGSASASEIVSGAIQDLDRGVIIGQRTFGKGLVQNIIPLSYNASMKVTVAKYYIPSGRCIQAIDYSHKDEDGHFNRVPDSLLTEFKTTGGRKVYDGAGIAPDIEIDPVKYSNCIRSLVRNYLIFNYATEYYQKHKTIAAATDFKLSVTDYENFKSYVLSKEWNYSTRSSSIMKNLKETAEREKYYGDAEVEIKALEEKLNTNKEKDLDLFEEEISQMLASEIITRYYYSKGKILYSFNNDPELEEAKKLITNTEIYQSILSGTYKGK